MKKDIKQYIRVGIDFYKETTIPMAGEDITVLRKWNKQTIIDDFGRKALKDVEKYEGFCFIPAHSNFEKVINGFYNKYEPISYKLTENGEWSTIKNLLEHVFGEQYELGIDYLTLLWQNPTQVLPILCLVSNERNTGKTTFLIMLKLLFEGNMTLNTNEDFRSRFNSDWAGKLIIAIDEVLLDKKEDSERIKNLSTARYYKAEAKGKDKEEVEFFGKFILCSNNEENFIKIDKVEIRYWVRKIPILGSTINPNLIKEIEKEIPSFAHFLNVRKVISEQKTRMWFTKEQIHTQALDLLINGNKTSLEKELDEMLAEQFILFEKEELCYTSTNLVQMLKARGFNASNYYVASVLRTKYEILNNEKNSTYKWYRSDIASDNLEMSFTAEKGRYFVLKRESFVN